MGQFTGIQNFISILIVEIGTGIDPKQLRHIIQFQGLPRIDTPPSIGSVGGVLFPDVFDSFVTQFLVVGDQIQIIGRIEPGKAIDDVIGSVPQFAFKRNLKLKFLTEPFQ